MFLWPRKELLKKHRSNLHAAHRMLLRPCPYVIIIWILKLGFSRNIRLGVCVFNVINQGGVSLFGSPNRAVWWSHTSLVLQSNQIYPDRRFHHKLSIYYWRCGLLSDDEGFPTFIFFSHTGESDVRWKFRVMWSWKLPLLRIINWYCLEHLTKTFLTPPEGRRSSSSSSAPTQTQRWYPSKA